MKVATIRRQVFDFGRRHTIAIGVVALVLVAALFVVLAAWFQLRGALEDLSAAREAIATAEQRASEGDVDGVIESVTRAERRLSTARATLRSSAPIRIARVVPGVHQNIDAAEVLTDRAFEVAASARRLAMAAEPLTTTGVLDADGSANVDLIAEIRETSQQVRRELTELAPIQVGSAWMLAGQVEDAARDLAQGQAAYVDAVAAIDDGLALVEELVGADGPRRWLIVAANAAEMRGAGGMILSFAVLDSDRGQMTVSEVGAEEHINDLLDEPPDVHLPADYELRYGRQNLIGDIRNSTVSADFTIGGPVVEAVYEKATGDSVDGVIQIDSMALARLLDVTGPLTVDGVGDLTAESVVDVTLHDLYLAFDDVEARQEALGSVAAEVVDRTFTAGADPVELLTAIQESLHGRNLMLYASDPDLQARLVEIGAHGGLPVRSNVVHLAVENFSANKLDYFVDTDLSLTGTWEAGETGEVTASITIANRTPADATEPRYVFGPADTSLITGEYRAHVVLYLPGGTGLAETSPTARAYDIAAGTENGRTVVTFTARVLAGETVAIDLPLEFPGVECPSLSLVPSPRIHPTTGSVDINTGSQTWKLEAELTDTVVLGELCA